MPPVPFASYAPETVADQKPMVKKIWKKYEKSWDGLSSSPKSKRGQKPFGILP